MGIWLNYLARVRISEGHTEVSDQLHVGSGNLSWDVTWAWLSQMVTYLVCDELKYGFTSAYEQS